MKKYVYITLGTISLGLGILGIFLPLLPTTPFLLLTAALYCHSSEKLYNKLMNHKLLGPYIHDFRTHKNIPLKTKIISISLVWLTIGYSIIFVVPLLFVKILLAAIAIAVTMHILSFKTKK
jgi:uncharacterized protein